MLKILGIAALLLSSFAQADTHQSNNKTITEYFWYGCGHCYHLEEKLDDWLVENPDITIQRRPAAPSRLWERHAKLFYVIESLSLPDEAHDKVFDLIHLKDERMVYLNEWGDLIRQYKPDLSNEDIESISGSFSVVTQVDRDNKEMKALGIMGVPAFVIEGKVYSAGDYEDLDQLLKAVKAAVHHELP